MEHTFHDLKKKKVSELRVIAKEAGVTGSSQMNKDHLLKEVCEKLKIDMFEHHVAKSDNKGQIKAKIKVLKVKRDEALEAHDHKALKTVRRSIHKLKRALHKAAV